MGNRKVILFIAISLDGYIARESGEIDWLTLSEEQVEEDTMYDKFYQNVDTVIMGRKTYDQVTIDLSPESYPYADSISYVVTSKPKNAFNDHAIFYTGDVTGLVSRLKGEDGNNIWIIGGNSIITPLINVGLIDRFEIAIVPVILGSGIPLFKNIKSEHSLRLVSSIQKNQLVYLSYEYYLGGKKGETTTS